MFAISHDPIDPSALRRTLAHTSAGGFVSFEGWVRDRNEGKRVAALEYEASEPLAMNEFDKIEQEAREQFEILDVHCTHRVGRLALGELAVWIGVTAPHRDAAFRACRYLIDELKKRLPIWKKEHYDDGDSGWLNTP